MYRSRSVLNQYNYHFPVFKFNTFFSKKKLALFSNEELIATAVALNDENRKNKEECERKMENRTHPNLINRKLEREYYTLYPHLVDNNDKFNQ